MEWWIKILLVSQKKVETIIIHQILIDDDPWTLFFAVFHLVDKKPLIELLQSQLWEPKTKDSEDWGEATAVIKDILFPPFFDTCVKHHLCSISSIKNWSKGNCDRKLFCASFSKRISESNRHSHETILYIRLRIFIQDLGYQVKNPPKIVSILVIVQKNARA